MRKFIGNVAVDSGQIMIVDPFYMTPQNGKTFDDVAYLRASEKTMRPEKCGQIVIESAGPGAKAIISGNKWGDGLFPVYANLNKAGEISSITIKF